MAVRPRDDGADHLAPRLPHVCVWCTQEVVALVARLPPNAPLSTVERAVMDGVRRLCRAFNNVK